MREKDTYIYITDNVKYLDRGFIYVETKKKVPHIMYIWMKKIMMKTISFYKTSIDLQQGFVKLR